MELLGPGAQISCGRPSSQRSSIMSFDYIIIPLLRVLTCDALLKSIMYQEVNQLFALLYSMDLSLRLSGLCR